MELNKEQKKIILNKLNTYSVVSGLNLTGKTTIGVHRALYLKNNFCLYEEDNILIVPMYKDLNHVKNLYERAKEENKFNYLTLFSNDKDRVSIIDINSIIINYFNQFSKISDYTICDINIKMEIIKECIKKLKGEYSKLKILDYKNINFFIDEISWIKSCNLLTLEQYQNADRYGRNIRKGEGPQRLLKNSSAREAIYEIMKLYNMKLKELKYFDEEDRALYALYSIRNNPIKKYTHLIIDEGQNLTKVQLDFIKELCNNKSYSSMMLILNNECNVKSNSWFIKSSRIKELNSNAKVKRFTLKKKIKEEYIGNIEKINVSSVENYKYCDIRHNREYDFMVDYSNLQEFIVNNDKNTQEYNIDELNSIPVYNNIAAGQPILINSEVEGSFSIPKYWLKGMNDCFILKVKGDSMIGANIEDGDYVVINKSYSVQNRDIVAVDLDGSATLKRLILNKDGVLLMPENEKYLPIPINDGEAYFIGVAVGIIKASSSMLY